MSGSVALTIGNFDGVHPGHAALLRECRRLAGPSGRVVAMMFHPHPLATLDPGAAPAVLTGPDHREELLRLAGADEVVRLAPTPALLALSPEEFIGRVVEEHRPSFIVEGSDFRFGRGRGGDAGVLRTLGRAHGFEVSIVEPVTVELMNQTVVPASSTLARWLVVHGRVEDAAIVLGRPHELRGTVEPGDRRGREIGFPTANLRTRGLPPGDGVYAATAVLPDGRQRPSAVHVGPRATFDSGARTVEAYIIGWDGALRAGGTPGHEYGWPLRLRFTAWLRDQGRFDSVGALVEQIRRDAARAERMYGARSHA